MPTRYDESYAPVVVLHVIGASTNEEVLERIDFLKAVLKRKQPLALVFDATDAEPIDAHQRRMWSHWLATDEKLIRAWMMGCAFVVTSAIMRGVFTGIFWIWPPPMPYVFTGTRPEAIAWANESLRGRARVGTPPT
jgi:hypothetical protein